MKEQEKAIEAIKNDLEWHKKDLKPKYREYLNMAIEALEEQEKNRWIPVEERLPEERFVRNIFNRPDGTISDGVFVTIESHECDGTHYYTGTDMMRNGKWLGSSFVGGSAIYSQKVIAWMPLPEPYKGEIK